MSCNRIYCFPPWTERNSIFIQGARPVTVYHRLPVRNRLRLLIAQHMTVTVQHPPFSSHFPHSLTEPCVRARVRARAPSSLKCKCNSTAIISFIVQFHAVADLCGIVIHELHQMCHAKRKPLVKEFFLSCAEIWDAQLLSFGLTSTITCSTRNLPSIRACFCSYHTKSWTIAQTELLESLL